MARVVVCSAGLMLAVAGSWVVAAAAPAAIPARVSLRAAMPDAVVGKSDGVSIELRLLAHGREVPVARQEITARGWHTITGAAAVAAGEPFVVRVVMGPRRSPAFDAVGFHSLVVTAAGLSRNLLAMASPPRVMLRGKLAPFTAKFSGGQVLIDGQRRTPWLLTHQPFGGKPCEMVIDFPSPPLFPGLVNVAGGSVGHATSTAPGSRPEAACDGRYDLAGASSWTDNTPDDLPDALELHLPYQRPAVVQHVVVIPNCGMARSAALRAAELSLLGDGGWEKLPDRPRVASPYFWWQLHPARAIRALRVVATDTAGELTRILEVEAWGPKPSARRLQPASILRVDFPLSALQPGEPVEVGATVDWPGDAPLAGTLHAQLRTRGGRTVAEASRVIRLLPATSRRISLSLGSARPGVWSLRVWLAGGQWVAAEARGRLDVPSAAKPPEPRKPRVHVLDPRDGIISVTARMAGGAPAGRRRLELARAAGADLVTAWTGLKDIEPRPWCFDLAGVEELVERARGFGLGVELLVMMNDPQVPDWLAGHEIRDSLGRPVALHAGRGDGGRTPSYWSPLFRQHWRRLIAETVARFGGADEIKIWHFRPGDLDVFFHDIPAQRRVYDYSPWARDKFREYLRDVRGLTLSQVNRRWAVALKSWRQLHPPQPRFDAHVDLRPAWADFVDFKQWTLDQLLELTFSTVRQYDPRRPLALWALGGSGALDSVLRQCARYGALASFNSIEHPYNSIWLDLARRAGAMIRTETGRLPPRPDNFARSWFFALAGGANMYVWVGPIEADNPAWKVFCRSGDFFRALSGATPASRDVGALFGYSYYRQKSFQWTVFARHIKPEVRLLLDAERRGLVELDWFSDYSTLDGLERYRLIIEANSPLLPGRVVDALARYVRAGGTLLLMESSGKWLRGDPSSRNVLLRALARPDGLQPGPDGLERWPLGHGRVFRLPHPVEQAEMDAAIEKVMREAGLQRPVQASEGLWVARIRKAGRLWTLVYNTAAATRRVEVAVEGMGQRATLWILGDRPRAIQGHRIGRLTRLRFELPACGLAAIGSPPL